MPKAVSLFYKTRRKCGDGYSGYCRACTIASAKGWQVSNPERVLEKWRADSRKYKDKPEEYKERRRDAVADWGYRHPKERKAHSKKAKLRAREKDPVTFRVKTALYNNRRRALRYGVPSDFTINDWQCLLRVFGGRCPYCGGTPPFLDLDHIYPIHLGGHDVVGNISPICRPCNSHKSYSKPEDFAAYTNINLSDLLSKCQVRLPDNSLTA